MVRRVKDVIPFVVLIGSFYLVMTAWEHSPVAGILTIIAIVLIIVLVIKMGSK